MSDHRMRRFCKYMVVECRYLQDTSRMVPLSRFRSIPHEQEQRPMVVQCKLKPNCIWGQCVDRYSVCSCFCHSDFQPSCLVRTLEFARITLPIAESTTIDLLGSEDHRPMVSLGSKPVLQNEHVLGRALYPAGQEPCRLSHMANSTTTQGNPWNLFIQSKIHVITHIMGPNETRYRCHHMFHPQIQECIHVFNNTCPRSGRVHLIENMIQCSTFVAHQFVREFWRKTCYVTSHLLCLIFTPGGNNTVVPSCVTNQNGKNGMKRGSTPCVCTIKMTAASGMIHGSWTNLGSQL